MEFDEQIERAFLSQVGRNIKRIRKSKKWSMEDLGLEVGLTRMHINRIEKGYNITLKTILKLAIALEVDPYVLVRVLKK